MSAPCQSSGTVEKPGCPTDKDNRERDKMPENRYKNHGLEYK